MVDRQVNVPKTSENILRAAEAGNTEAQCELGMMYEHGLGMPKDFQAAILWYRTAADHGSGYAAYKIAQMFENGHGVQQDITQVAQWLKRAAECGLPEAQYKLGTMLETGRGVNQRWSEAASWYLQAANQGISDAQFRLGHMYENGLGVQKDMPAAGRYYKMAAEKGNAGAQYSLAVLHVTGEGVEKDTVEAARLFEMAAQNGHARAKQKFSEQMSKQTQPLHRQSEARDKADEGTPKWWRKTKEADNEEELADFMIATLRQTAILSAILATYCLTPLGDVVGHLIRSTGIVIFFIGFACLVVAGIGGWNFFKKKMQMPWFQLAGFSIVGLIGIIIVGVTCFNGYILEPLTGKPAGKKTRITKLGETASSSLGRRSTPEEQIADMRAAQKKRMAQLEAESELNGTGSGAEKAPTQQLAKSADKGDARAQYQLGSRYEVGANGVEQDEKNAIGYYKQAATSNNKPAETRLGVVYKRTGEDGQPNYAEALKYLGKAANEKYPAAQYQLALMYEYGEGVPRNYKTAAQWYGKAADSNDPWAQFRLGQFHMDGSGVEQSYGKALSLFTSSAAQHNWKAEDKLSELYTTGVAVPKSPDLAQKWSAAAAKDKARPVKHGSEAWLHETVEEQDEDGSSRSSKR